MDKEFIEYIKESRNKIIEKYMKTHDSVILDNIVKLCTIVMAHAYENQISMASDFFNDASMNMPQLTEQDLKTIVDTFSKK